MNDQERADASTILGTLGEEAGHMSTVPGYALAAKLAQLGLGLVKSIVDSGHPDPEAALLALQEKARSDWQGRLDAKFPNG